MDLRQLEYFRAIVDAGSLSAAARALHVAQPTLTVAMRKLEREAGTSLLIRTAPGVVPTEAGTYLHAEARRILTDVKNASTQLRALARGQAGNLALAVTPSYSWAHLAEVLGRLSRTAPGIHVQLSDPPPLEIIDQVDGGDCNLGIVASYDVAILREQYGERVHLHPLCPLPVVAVLPPAFADHGPVVSLDSLRDEAWIVPLKSQRFPGMAALTEELWRRRGWTPRTVREVSTSQTGLPMIAGGLGAALMPGSLSGLAGASVAVRDVREDVPPLVAVAIWQRGRTVTPATRLFLDILADVHGSLGGGAGQE